MQESWQSLKLGNLYSKSSKTQKEKPNLTGDKTKSAVVETPYRNRLASGYWEPDWSTDFDWQLKEKLEKIQRTDIKFPFQKKAHQSSVFCCQHKLILKKWEEQTNLKLRIRQSLSI